MIINNEKHQQAVLSLSSSDPSEQLKAIRLIKNSIIGNITKKELYMELNISPKLIEILSDNKYGIELKIQAAVIIGSVANGNEYNISRLVQDGAIEPLLKTFESEDPRLYEAGARALKALFESEKTPHDILFKEPFLKNLISLLKPSEAKLETNIIRNNPYRLSEVIAQLISKISVTADEQNKIAQSNAIPLLLNLIDIQYDFYPKVQEAALEAVACLCKENKSVCNEIIKTATDDKEKTTIDTLLKLIHSKRPVMKLLAATCLTNIYRAGVLPPENKSDILLIVLPTLIKLLNINDINGSSISVQWTNAQERAPMVFSYLIAENEELQKAAMEGDAIVKLANVIKKTSPQEESINNYENYSPTSSTVHMERLKESALFAIASICAYKEEYRKQVIEAKLLPYIVQSMSHPNFGIRMAACHCTKSLSRSVKNLRTCLVDSGVVMPLLKLLSDPDIQVQTVACAALCNVVLDFSPMKKSVLENGGVQRLVTLVHSMDANLRLNAIWALKNILFKAESSIKDQIMKELGWEQFYTLINDDEFDIQEQAMNLLRNLACSSEYDIEETLKGLGESRVVYIFESKLQWGIANTQSQNPNQRIDDIMTQTIWSIANIYAGNEKHKKLLMTDTILSCLKQFLTHQKQIIRLAVIWCCLNLTNPDDIGTQERITKLKSLSFHTVIQSLINDPIIDIRNKIKALLKNFEDPTDLASTALTNMNRSNESMSTDISSQNNNQNIETDEDDFPEYYPW